jgi:hypothetical protein
MAFKVPPGDTLTLEAVGPHPIHVIGYLQPLAEGDGYDEPSDEEEEEEESGSV